MDRIFTRTLSAWKQTSGRKPLIVRGAQQVGKSYTIREFGLNDFQGTLHIVDLERHPEWHSVFDHNLDPHRILKELEILLNASIVPGEDLLFLDEIQACPRAIMALRYFYEEIPGLHVIAAGSLLEFVLGTISFPVGRVQLATMLPMNFYEFLIATGKHKLAEIISTPPVKLPDAIHAMLLENLKQYLYVGGMPECVKTYSEGNNLYKVFNIQSDLVHTFRQDFSKYKPNTAPVILNHCLDYISRNIGQQIKYSRISPDFSGPTLKKGLELLQTGKLITKIRATSAARLPFSSFASEKKFKMILLDSGLMHALNGIRANAEYTNGDLLNMYQGALAEQFAGQEFLSANHESLYYWDRQEKSSMAEVDYLISVDHTISPVEVKSGSSGRLRSLHQLLKEHPDIRMGYCLSSAPYGIDHQQRITFIPLYYAWWLASSGAKTLEI